MCDNCERERAARERAERERDEARAYGQKWRRIRVPEHGTCCTCQGCGKVYDECRCCLDEAVDAGQLWESRAIAAESALAAEREAHAETKKANREAERIFLDELLARRAAESALADEREAHAETRASLEAAKRDHEGACLLVAKMHHAATGAIQGPIRGVVEDVADVRSRLAAAEERLRGIREWAAGLGWLGSPQDERIESEVLAIINPAFLAGGKP